MSKAAAKRIEEQLRSVFPEGAISRVEVLGYGDDPAVEPHRDLNLNRSQLEPQPLVSSRLDRLIQLSAQLRDHVRQLDHRTPTALFTHRV